MSHVVQVQTEVRDPVALASACQRLGLAPPVEGRFKLFTADATGLGIVLPSWNYPVVCDTATGRLQYDNYEGRWGDQRCLDQLVQMYAVEKTKIEARRRGHAVFEQSLADGSIKLTVLVAGGAA